MKKLIFQTNTNNWSAFILRITLGIVLFAHGAQKLLGWFDGYGYEGTMQFFTGHMQLPWVIGFAVIVIEFFGSLSILAGFATRLWSIAVACQMIGVVVTVHLQNGFFMNWYNTQKGEGIEYFLFLISITLSLLLTGAGKWSLDGIISLSRNAHAKASVPSRSKSLLVH